MYELIFKLRRVFLIVHFQSSLSEVYSRLKLHVELDLLHVHVYGETKIIWNHDIEVTFTVFIFIYIAPMSFAMKDDFIIIIFM